MNVMRWKRGEQWRIARLAIGNVLTAFMLFLGGAAQAADTTPLSTDLPDLSAIRARIYSGEYEKAAKALLELTETVRHADLYNLLGYANRKLERYQESARWYKEALLFDATHRPALEYQGELFIALGDFKSAQKNLEVLRLLCHPAGCEELAKLEEALARAVAPKS